MDLVGWAYFITDHPIPIWYNENTNSYSVLHIRFETTEIMFYFYKLEMFP
jgi:hypothetical protein